VTTSAPPRGIEQWVGKSLIVLIQTRPNLDCSETVHGRFTACNASPIKSGLFLLDHR
jgi:hypothetical protein